MTDQQDADATTPVDPGKTAPLRWIEASALLGGAALVLVLQVGPGSWLIRAAVLLWWVAVVVVVRSDLTSYVIPDLATATITALGLATAVAPSVADGAGREAGAAALDALSNGALAFALFWATGWCFRRFGGREALGFGDVKLAGASAIWLAPGDAAVALEVAAISAIAVLLVGRRTGPLRDTAVPFGAFMAPAAWLTYVLGPAVRDSIGMPPW